MRRPALFISIAALLLAAGLPLAPLFAADAGDAGGTVTPAELREKRRQDMSRLAKTVAEEHAEEEEKTGKRGEEPTLEHIAMVALLMVCGSVGLVTLMILYTVLRPQRVIQGGELFRQRPVRCLCAGILASVILLVVAGVANVLPGALKGLVFLALVLLYAHWAVSGLCMLAHDLGERLQSNLNVRSLGSSGMAVLYGGGVLMLAGFLPGLGQAVQFIALVSGLGAAVSRRFLKAPASAVDDPAPVETKAPVES